MSPCVSLWSGDFDSASLEELLTPDWTWLVARPHPWRRQLWIKGRKHAAGDLARTAEVEGWTAEETARQFDLPVEAVLEARPISRPTATSCSPRSRRTDLPWTPL